LRLTESYNAGKLIHAPYIRLYSNNCTVCSNASVELFQVFLPGSGNSPPYTEVRDGDRTEHMRLLSVSHAGSCQWAPASNDGTERLFGAMQSEYVTYTAIGNGWSGAESQSSLSQVLCGQFIPAERQLTKAPTAVPTNAPTEAPTKAPTQVPTQAPSHNPTQPPTDAPTKGPSNSPSVSPTSEPTLETTADSGGNDERVTDENSPMTIALIAMGATMGFCLIIFALTFWLYREKQIAEDDASAAAAHSSMSRPVKSALAPSTEGDEGETTGVLFGNTPSPTSTTEITPPIPVSPQMAFAQGLADDPKRKSGISDEPKDEEKYARDELDCDEANDSDDAKRAEIEDGSLAAADTPGGPAPDSDGESKASASAVSMEPTAAAMIAVLDDLETGTVDAEIGDTAAKDDNEWSDELLSLSVDIESGIFGAVDSQYDSDYSLSFRSWIIPGSTPPATESEERKAV